MWTQLHDGVADILVDKVFMDACAGDLAQAMQILSCAWDDARSAKSWRELWVLYHQIIAWLHTAKNDKDLPWWIVQAEEQLTDELEQTSNEVEQPEEPCGQRDEIGLDDPQPAIITGVKGVASVVRRFGHECHGV